MSNQIQNPNFGNKYNLKERTENFGTSVIVFLKKIPQDAINKPLISQLVRSATSIGANYMEADGAESKKDFQHKIALCKKESKETTHWLQMICIANPACKEESEILWKEAHELTLIFSAIYKNCR